MVSETVNRKTYLDALRVLAAFLVIFNHTEGFHLFLEQAADGSAASWLRVMLSVFTKINVPVFFMISGALLLGREESYGVLLRKRVARFLSVLVLFSLVIYLDRNPESRDMSDFVYGLFSGEINLSYWFLYAYLGMLLALPFLRKIAGKLALFADKNKRNSQFFCQWSSKNKTAAFNGCNSINIFFFINSTHFFNYSTESGRISKKTCNVIKFNSRFWKIRYTTDCCI